jgi:cell wall-associated NlpC family hydrolase
MVGVPYWWGKGTPATLWPSDAYDCSGFAQGALVFLGQLRKSEPDRGAHDLANASDQVDEADVRLGDMAFYGGRDRSGAQHISHVMLCLGGEWVIGASGGGSKTLGNDPKAYVQLRRDGYRDDLVCFGRLKDSFHP